MRNWNVNSKINLLAFIPTLLVALLLGSYFTLDKFIEVNSRLQQLGATTISELEPAVKIGLQQKNVNMLQNLSDTALANSGVIAISIFDNKGKLMAYSGPDALIGKDLPTIKKIMSAQPNIFTITRPLPIKEQPNTKKNISSSTQLGWVNLAIANTTYADSKIQTVLVTLIILFLGLLLACIIKRMILQLINKPLYKIHKAVQNIQDGNYNYKIYNLPGKEFSSIAKGLNRIKNMMQKLEESQQDYLSQETNDLKHTLEEIEIQNIELNIALKNAQRDNRRKSEFIASLSHEIRTPMSSIIGFTNLLLEGELTRYQQEYLITIQKSANTLLAIINDILDFSKIEAGKFKLDSIPFDFTDTLDEILQSLAPEAQKKQIELIPLYSPDIPTKLVGDPLRLKQILTNLVFNAIKFTEEGSVCLKAELLKKSDQIVTLQVSVIDTGIGLSDKDKKVLFRAFSQADIAIARKFGGTGLGLVISKQFIEQMGGNIEIHSKLGIGSTICFTLNFSMLSEIESARKPNLIIKKSILVYDAHLLSRKSIKQCLHDRISQLTVVDTYKQLTLKLEEMKQAYQLPDRVLLSLTNFELNSKQTNDILHLITCDYKVTVTTLINTANENAIRELSNHGATNCLIKPISSKKLITAITETDDSYQETDKTLDTLTLSESPIKYEECNVLVAEDNPANLKLIVSLFENLGVSINTAVDGKLAVQACDNKKYSLIFLDLQMPNMNGYDAAEHIRHHSRYNRTTPIIAISAYIAEDDKQKLFSLGFNELLTKPVDINTLQFFINKWSNKSIEVQPNTVDLQINGYDKKLNLENEAPIELPILDLEKTIQLSAGSKELAIEIIEMFSKELPQLTESIHLYYNNQDWQKLTDVIHKINGSSRFCAMIKLQNTANDFEQALKNSEEHLYPGFYKTLQFDISDLQIHLAAILT